MFSSARARSATPRLAQRALQMACRLLAYNAEHWLANRLNTYLGDPDEYRAITRHLRHTGGVVHKVRDSIHIELDPPDSPGSAVPSNAPRRTHHHPGAHPRRPPPAQLYAPRLTIPRRANSGGLSTCLKMIISACWTRVSVRVEVRSG